MLRRNDMKRHANGSASVPRASEVSFGLWAMEGISQATHRDLAINTRVAARLPRAGVGGGADSKMRPMHTEELQREACPLNPAIASRTRCG